MINGNSKQGEGRVSFSNVRGQHNKENQLSFQNLRRQNTMMGSECSSTCSNPYDKNVCNPVVPLFKNFASKAGFNQTSSVKLASRVKDTARLSSGEKNAWLES